MGIIITVLEVSIPGAESTLPLPEPGLAVPGLAEPGLPRLDPGLTKLDPGLPKLEPGLLKLDPGLPILDPGFAILDAGLPEPVLPAFVNGRVICCFKAEPGRYPVVVRIAVPGL